MNYIIYCYVEPNIKIFFSSENVKTNILNNYTRMDLFKSYKLNFDISFTEDERKATRFHTREVALKCVEFLGSVIPEDFKIGVANE